jgi:hypothetical protein
VLKVGRIETRERAQLAFLGISHEPRIRALREF